MGTGTLQGWMWEEAEKSGHEHNLLCTYEAWETGMLHYSEVGRGGRRPWLQGQTKFRKLHLALCDLFVFSTLAATAAWGVGGFARLRALQFRPAVLVFTALS